MKKLAIMGMTLALFITGCTPKPAGPQNAGGGEQKPIDVTILTASARENDANIVRDLLAKNGFNPIMNIQPDFASVSAIRETGEWDITISAWNIVSGNADYAMRPLFYTGSPSNSSGIADPTLDAMIDEGASANIDESWDIYAELERYLVEEMAYIAPLYGKTKNQAVNQTVIVPETAPIPKTRSIGRLEQYEYVDPSNNETRPLNLTSTEASYTSLWPPRQNDTYSAYFTENMYVTLITLDDDGNLMTDGTLSYNYAPTDARDEFYFILRDNITYLEQVGQRLTDIWNEELSAVCTGCEQADEATCCKMKAAVQEHDAPEELKALFLDRLQQRVEEIWSAENGALFEKLYLSTDITDSAAVTKTMEEIKRSARTSASGGYISALEACTEKDIRKARTFQRGIRPKLYAVIGCTFFLMAVSNFFLLHMGLLATILCVVVSLVFLVLHTDLSDPWEKLALKGKVFHPTLTAGLPRRKKGLPSFVIALGRVKNFSHFSLQVLA